MLDNVNWNIVSFVIAAILNLITLVGAYYGLKAEVAAVAKKLELDTTTLTSKFEISLVTERAARSLDTLNASSLLKNVEVAIKDISDRVMILEQGNGEWMKTLRERTHELSNQMNDLVLKVDRLERPSKGS